MKSALDNVELRSAMKGTVERYDKLEFGDGPTSSLGRRVLVVSHDVEHAVPAFLFRAWQPLEMLP